MFAFIATELLVLIIIIGLLLILSGVWPPDSPWAPWWQMPDGVIKKMCRMVKMTSKDTVYDLGCGTGKALIHGAKTYGARGVGIEIDPIRYWIARFNLWKIKRSFSSEQSESRSKTNSSRQARTIQITFLKENFFNVNLASATVIFVYLVPKALKKLTPKFLKEVKPGTKFISYIYPMPQELFKGKLQLVKRDKESKIFYYRLLS